MTQFLIINSSEDLASLNIRNNFLNSKLLKWTLQNIEWQEHPIYKLESILTKEDRTPFFIKHQILLGLTDSPLIHLDGLEFNKSELDPDFLIFASRHRSESARPAFLTHITGNWGSKADFGGAPRELSRCSAILLKVAFSCLKYQFNLDYFNQFTNFSLDIEVTHHGPTTLEKPLIFMELGSSEKEWVIPKAGELVARAIIETCFKYFKIYNNKSIKIGLGFGGTHYAPQFRKLISFKNVAISFICPKYYIKELNKDMIKQMINNTIEKVDYFIIDWKGINSADKQYLIPILEDFDIPIKKTKEF
ncbi:MAG: D-aminoacyl-tRNA deacylase [Promethearchaeota archaeon]